MSGTEEFMPDFNFSIDNTGEMGAGNTDLMESFLSETTPKLEELEEINTNPKKVDSKKKEELDATKKNEQELARKKAEEEALTKKKADKAVNSFLNGEEEEEEEEEEININKEKEEEEEEPVEINKFEALSKDLFKLGVFSKDEEEGEVEIKTPEEFLERFKTEAKRKAEQEISSYISQFGPDYQHAFNAIYVDGVDPKEYYTSFNKISNFSELDLSKEEVQVAVIREALVEQGFDAEDIPAEIERFRNYGDLGKVSKNFQKVLIKKEAQKIEQNQKDSQAKLQQQAVQKQQYVQNVNNVLAEKLKTKEFDGIPVNPELAKEVQNFLLVDKYRTQSGENLTDFDKVILELKRPENHQKKVKLALLLKVMEKDPNLTTIAKTKLSKESTILFEELTKGGKKEKVEKKVGAKSAFNYL